MPLTVGHSRSTRVTRGEPRPVHITLIGNDCHLSGLNCQLYSSVVVVRRITPGLSPGYETSTDRLINVLSNVSGDLGRSLSCASFSRPRKRRFHNFKSQEGGSSRKWHWQLRTVIGLQQARGWWGAFLVDERPTQTYHKIPARRDPSPTLCPRLTI